MNMIGDNLIGWTLFCFFFGAIIGAGVMFLTCRIAIALVIKG